MRDCDSPFVPMRTHAILLLFDDDRSFDDVADIFKIHVNTARNWAKRWMTLKIDGLYDMPGRGAKPKFETWEKNLMIKYVEEEPRSLRHVLQKIERAIAW
jgi:transposase